MYDPRAHSKSIGAAITTEEALRLAQQQAEQKSGKQYTPKYDSNMPADVRARIEAGDMD